MVSLGGIGAGMAGGATVAIIIKAVDNYSKGLKGATKALDKFKKLGAAVAKVYAIGVAGAFMLGVKNAVREEKAVAKLTQQLKNHNQASKENIDSLTEVAYALQKLTGFADDQIIAGQAMLASFSLTTEQVRKLTPHLLNLAVMSENASGQQADLATTAKMVGIALGGQPGMLTKMGIKLSEVQKEMLKVANETEKINVLMEIFEENAGGLAVAVGDTLTGKVNILKNAFGDLTQSLAEDGGLMDILNSIVDLATVAVEKFNALTPEQKGNIAKGAIGTAAAVGAVTIYKGLQGTTMATPLFVWDVNPASSAGAVVAGEAVIVGESVAGGGIGATTAGGGLGAAGIAAIGVGIATSIGALLLSKPLAKEVGGRAGLNKDSPYNAEELWTSFFNIDKANTMRIQRLEEEKFKIDWDNAQESYNLWKSNKQLEEEKQTLQENEISLTSEQIKEIELLSAAETKYQEDMIELENTFNSGKITATQYAMEQYKLDNTIKDTRLSFTSLDADLKNVAETAANALASISKGSNSNIYEIAEAIGRRDDNSVYISPNIQEKLDEAGYDFSDKIKNDFISRPGMSPTSFSPNDTIIGVKNPGAMGGVTISIENIYGLDSDDIAYALQDKLSEMINV